MRRRANAAYLRKDQRWKDVGWTGGPNMMIRDPDMPLELVGLWMWLASHTDEFELSGRILHEGKATLGKNKAYQLLRDLEERGYLIREHHFDAEQGVPYQLYYLQIEPVDPTDRTFTPSRAKPKDRGGPGTSAQRTEGFPAGGETPEPDDTAAGEPAAHNGFTPTQESPPTRTFTSGQESGGGLPGSRFPDGGEPYKEEKIIGKEQILHSSASTPEGPTDREDLPNEQTDPPPSADALDLVVRRIDWPPGRKPTRVQADELAHAIDAAVTAGHDLASLLHHARAARSRARTNPIRYVLTALTPDQLPALPAPRAEPRRPITPAAPDTREPCPAVGGADVRSPDTLAFLDAERRKHAAKFPGYVRRNPRVT